MSFRASRDLQVLLVYFSERQVFKVLTFCARNSENSETPSVSTALQQISTATFFPVTLSQEDPVVRQQVAKVQWALRAISSRVWLLTRQLRRPFGEESASGQG